MDDHFTTPNRLRDKHRNLDALVKICLETNEDPLVLAAEAGVSPSALIRALPRSFLQQFLPPHADAASLPLQDILIRLASNHALDVAVTSVVGQELDARTMVSMSKDILDRASVVGHKTPPLQSRITLNDESLAKLAELERAFAQQQVPPGTIAPEFQSFHRIGNGSLSEEERLMASQEGWNGPVHPVVRDLDFDKDD